MELKSRKNDFGYDVVDCPFCPHWVYVRDTTKASSDPLRDLKRHITNEAKNEAFQEALATSGQDMATPQHLNYVKEHTKLQPVKTTVLKRQFDTDLKLL